MKKQKLSLQALKVNSFVTGQLTKTKTVKGGLPKITDPFDDQPQSASVATGACRCCVS